MLRDDYLFIHCCAGESPAPAVPAVVSSDADLCGGCQQRFKGKIEVFFHQASPANKACRDQLGGK